MSLPVAGRRLAGVRELRQVREIRGACDTDTLGLFTLAKARLIHLLRAEPSNLVVLRVLAKVFLEDGSQNHVGTMLTRTRIEEDPDVR